MPKLSIIICVNNTDTNLFEKCLEDVVTCTVTDREILVVDDGSTVDYGGLQRKFSDVKYIKTENKGTLAARLLGLRLAKGDYIQFVDSDDRLSFNYSEALVETAIKQNADIVLGDWAFLTKGACYTCPNDTTQKNTFMLEGPQVLQSFFAPNGTEHSWYALWNKVFSKELLLRVYGEISKYGVGKIVFAEDVLISFFAFLLARRVTNVHLGYYFWRVREDCQGVASQRKLLYRISQMKQVFDIMENALVSFGRHPEVVVELLKWKKFVSSTTYTRAKHFRSPYLLDVIKKDFDCDTLTTVSLADDKTYTKHHLLPQNIKEVNKFLQEMLASQEEITVYAKKGSYAHRQLETAQRALNKKVSLVNKKKLTSRVAPKEIYPVKLRLKHSYPVCLAKRAFGKHNSPFEQD